MTDTMTQEPTREELLRELGKVQSKLEKARRRRDADAIAYASTPDGAAETFRRYELTRDDRERKELKTTYLSGLSMAGEEYEERLRRGNAGDNDGPLAVIPVGSFRDPLTKALVEQRIMGTFRTTAASVDSNTVTVTLLRLLPDQQTRKRLRLDTTAELGALTANLTEIIATAWTDPATRKRLTAFLDDAAAPIDTAIAQRDQR
ncbi:hypothetical protein DQP55_11800 [Mycolicibacterium sp. GF69]|uniref:hypothetical protein n=1 Tax=Mycolicibacterium sp. GF69 TaxID=2267251 RepID=UPI000DCCD096|nr:hypothetical protein [Mycolicibacterium sp. GF69]RAV12305.1 hypothetical protein DQP55_11800 [Mycolicibacterium sp. GF69]